MFDQAIAYIIGTTIIIICLGIIIGFMHIIFAFFDWIMNKLFKYVKKIWSR